MHSSGADRKQQRHMMGINGLRGFYDERHMEVACLDHLLPDRGHRNQDR